MVQRLVPLSVRKAHNAATGTIYAALYVMFGVTVGLSLFVLWQQYDAAQKTAEVEAATVEEIYRLAGSFPSRRGAASRTSPPPTPGSWWTRSGRRWGRDGRASAEKFADELRESVQDFEPHTEAGRELRAEGLTQLDDLDERRALRLVEVREGLPPIMWVVLAVGGVITVTFTYLFGLETPWLHRLAVAALAVFVTLIIYKIGVLDYPCDNRLQVGPDAFVLVLDQIEEDARR